MRGCCTAIHRCAKVAKVAQSFGQESIGLLDYCSTSFLVNSRALHKADAVTIQQYSEAEGSRAVSANAFRCLDESLQGHCLPGSY